MTQCFISTCFLLKFLPFYARIIEKSFDKTIGCIAILYFQTCMIDCLDSVFG